MSNPFRYFNSSPEIIRTRCRCAASRISWPSAGSTSAMRRSGFGGTDSARCLPLRSEKGVAHMRGYPQWRRHLDEAFVKVNGKLCYLWRAVDHEGEVLEAVVAAKRDKAA